jgi:hypothetical protein
MGRCVYLSVPTVILALAIGGCGPPSATIDKEKEHILHVRDLASQYTSATKKPAKSIEELKDWAIKEGKATEDDFISTRDKQPYGLVSGMGVTIFEQTGKNGRCYLLQAGAVREVGREQLPKITEDLGRSMGGDRGPQRKK